MTRDFAGSDYHSFPLWDSVPDPVEVAAVRRLLERVGAVDLVDMVCGEN